MRRHFNKALWLFVHKIPWKPILIWGPWVLILLVIVFYQVENWRGARALEKAELYAAKKGISLDCRDYAPNPIPDEQNFINAKPLIDGRIAGFRKLDRSGIAGLSNDYKDYKFPRSTQTFHAQRRDLRKWLDPSNRPTTEKEAAQQLDLLLADRKAALDELCAELPTRKIQYQFDPRAIQRGESVVSFAEGHSFRLSFLCEDDLLIAIALGDNERAFQRIELLTAHLDAEWFSCLLEPIFKAVHLKAIDRCIWNLVQSQSLSPEETEKLLAQISSLSVAKDFQKVIHGELSHAQLLLAEVKKDRHLLTLDPMAGLGSPKSFLTDVTDFIYRRIPTGWLDKPHAETIRVSLESSHGIDFSNPSEFLKFRNRIHQYQEAKDGPFSDFFENAHLSAWVNVSESLQDAEVRHQLTLIGLELELFKHHQGHYPATLSDLETNLGRSLPIDYFTGKPFGYRLKTDQTPLVWSAGRNRIDEGGLPERMNEEGDIVWMLTPIVGLTEKDWSRRLRKHSGNYSGPR